MKTLPLICLVMLLITACQKEINAPKTEEQIAGATASKPAKTSVCHYDAVTGTSKTVIVTDPKALAAHLKHGDLQGECATVQATICDQIWMVKNLDVSTYRNGDAIPQVTDPTEWSNLTTGAWSYYNNDPVNGPIYGKLYNWYAVNDPRGLAPLGWHVPTDAEWTTVSTCLGGDAVAGGQMKSVGINRDGSGLWDYPNAFATNSSGFTGLPGGIREPTIGVWEFKGLLGYWWSSTEDISGFSFQRNLFAFDGPIYKFANLQKTGMSVRCVKD